MARASIRNRGIRWIAALGAALLVGGCGTRLDNARIEAAAGVNQPVGALGAAAPAGGATTSADPGSVATSDAAAAPAADAQAASPAAGSGAAASTGAATSGAAGPSAGSANATKTGAATARVASGTAGGGGAAATSGNAAGTEGGVSTTPGAPTPTPGAGGATPAAGGKAPIVLGHVGDYSGLIGTLMKGGDVTAQVVARYVNDNGGLDGHPIKVIVGDAGGDPARALSLVRDMVENKGAIAIFGTLMVFSGYGPRDYLEQHKIPIIGGDGTTNAWLESPMYFTSSANFPGISFGAIKGLADLGKKKVAILYCVEAEQCKTYHDTAAAKASSLGVKIVYDAQVSLAQPDFTAECIQAQRAGAEGVMTGFDGPSIVRFARSCSQQGYKPQMMTASLAVIDSIAKDPNLDGLMAPQGVFHHVATDLPAEQAFRAAMARYAPNVDITPAVGTVWTGGQLLREVSKKLPDGKVSPADFFPGLYAVKANTLGGLVGPLTFNAGSTASEVRCVFYIKIAGGKWTAPFGSKQYCF
jgi:branched-chain amino acid transport system substrate-binding protein